MTSSQIAQTATYAVGLVSVLALTSAQLRVFRRPPPRTTALVIAWVVCTLVLGGLLVTTGTFVGRTDVMQRVTDVAIAMVVSGVALGTAEWTALRPAWATLARGRRILLAVLISLGATALLLGALIYL